MPTDPFRQTGDVGDPAKLELLEALLVVQLPSLRVGEYSIRILGIRAEAPPPKQQFFKTRVERNVVLGVLRLSSVYTSTEIAALNDEAVRF